MIESGKILQQRYRIDRQIGQGGMGSVYVANDQRFGSSVAVKQTLCGDDNFRKALEREARLLNSLKHVALPQVSDHFEEDEGLFIVMEYIPGEDLSSTLLATGKPFPVEQVLTWADQLLDALDFLHTQSTPVIHRDIKPQNLKITSLGQIILLDFGLAKGNPTEAGNQTAAKSIFGYSRNYASLEQIQGTGTDPRSDLYSLAATLYHLLTGIAPEDALTRAMSVLSHRPDTLIPARTIRPEIPPGVSAILQKALDLNAAARPSTAKEMREMLQEHERYADLVPDYNSAVTIADAAVHAQQTQLMPETTRGGNVSPTEFKTQIMGEDRSEATAIAGSGTAGSTVITDASLSSTGVNGRKRRPMAIAAGLAGVLLVGAGIAGGLYEFGGFTGTNQVPEAPQLPQSIQKSESEVTANAVVSEMANTEAEAVSDPSKTLEPQPPESSSTEDAAKGKQPSAQQKPAKTESPGTEVETMNINENGDKVRITKNTSTGAVTVTETAADGSVTKHTFKKGTFPMDFAPIPTRPGVPMDPNRLQNLTPAQRRRLKAAVRREAMSGDNPPPEQP